MLLRLKWRWQRTDWKKSKGPKKESILLNFSYETAASPLSLTLKHVGQMHSFTPPSKFCVQMDAWSDHKERTIAVLLCIRKRENALSALRSIAMRTDPSEQLNPILYTYAQQLQTLTIEVVNHIDQWREPLSLPYPFLWKGSNYLLKCAKDCLTLKEDGLSKLLKVSYHPSNDTSYCTHSHSPLF
jgi:hypothetical protein